MTEHSSTGTAGPLAKIRHRGVFVERQGGNGVYRYICHTGISKFLPDLYETQAAAIEAIDAKFAAAADAAMRALRALALPSTPSGTEPSAPAPESSR